MSLAFGQPFALGTTCGVSILGFDHAEVPICMTKFPQSTPFLRDSYPVAQAKADLPISSGVSETQASNGTPPNGAPSSGLQEQHPVAQAKADLPISSGVSETQVSNGTPPNGSPSNCLQEQHPVAQAKADTQASNGTTPNGAPSNGRQEQQPVPFRQPLTSSQGNPIATSARLAERTLRHRVLDYEDRYQRQIADGRPDERWMACGSDRCSKCTYYERLNMHSHKQHKATAWREDLFITAMLEVLGSAAVAGYNPRQEPVSRLDLDSFIQSPPIRGAFWEFHKTCGVSPQKVAPAVMAAKLTGIKPAVVRIAQAASIGELKLSRCTGDVKEQRHTAGDYRVELANLRNGGRLAGGREARERRAKGEATLDVHMCFAHYRIKRPQTWKLQDYLLQFCVVAESWRRYGLQRGCNWGFSGAETVADLLCAMLLNWWTMTAYDCFEKEKHTRLSINLVWDEWIGRYPRFLQNRLMEMEEKHQEQGSGSEEVLRGVGRAVKLGN